MVQVLVEHLGAALENLEAVRQDVQDLGSRLGEVEASHSALLHEVRSREGRDAVPGGSGARAAGLSALEERVQGLAVDLEARLDGIQSKVLEDWVGSAALRNEVEGMARAAAEEAARRSEVKDAVRNEELVEWQRQLLEEFEAWKGETIMDAAKVLQHLSSAIRTP